MKRIICGFAALLTAGSAVLVTDLSGGYTAAEQVMPDFSYLGTYGSLTADETAQAARSIYQALAGHADTIDFGTVKVTQSNYNDIVNLYSEVASVSDAGLLRSTKISLISSGGRILLQPGYLAEGAAYDEMYRDCEAKIEAILSGVDPSWSDAEKALYLHDYLAVHYEYDYPGLYGQKNRPYREQYTAYGLLRNGAAVCQGYSELYSVLLNRIGIPSRMVASNELNHAWNYVRIDGQWYFTDVTWDDCYQHYAGMMLHKYFLRTMVEMEAADHNTTDWLLPDGTNVYGAATSQRFSNAFWVQCGAVVPWNGKWAAFDQSDKTVKVFDYHAADDSVRTETVAAPEPAALRWPVIGKPGYYWGSAFVIPAAANGVLYYSLPDQIWAIRDNTPQCVLELTDEELQKGRIYGLYVQDGNLYYGIDSGLNQTDKLSKTITFSAVPLSSLEQKLAAGDEPSVPPAKAGDLDGDGILAVSDAVQFARLLSEEPLNPPEPAVLAAADLDADGILTLLDVRALLRAAAAH